MKIKMKLRSGDKVYEEEATLPLSSDSVAKILNATQAIVAKKNEGCAKHSPKVVLLSVRKIEES